MVAFTESNKTAHKTERRIAQVFLNCGWWVQHRLAYGSHDIAVMLPDGIFTIEVKDETKHIDSENICIETHQGEFQKYSGLFLTESNITIHVFGDECFLFRSRHMMMWMFHELQEGRLREIGMGDNNNIGILFPKRRLANSPYAKFSDYQKVINIPQSRLFKSRQDWLKSKVVRVTVAEAAQTQFNHSAANDADAKLEAGSGVEGGHDATQD